MILVNIGLVLIVVILAKADDPNCEPNGKCIKFCEKVCNVAVETNQECMTRRTGIQMTCDQFLNEDCKRCVSNDKQCPETCKVAPSQSSSSSKPTIPDDITTSSIEPSSSSAEADKGSEPDESSRPLPSVLFLASTILMLYIYN